MADKLLDYSGVETLWSKILKLINRKLRVSSSKGNLLKESADGLLVSPLHKLTFGPYEYDGSKDISVTVYDGEYEFEKE